MENVMVVWVMMTVILMSIVIMDNASWVAEMTQVKINIDFQ